MLIPQAAVVHVPSKEDWGELMIFLERHGICTGGLMLSPVRIQWDPCLDAIRIHEARFFRGRLRDYEELGIAHYKIEPPWWCVSSRDFIDRHDAIADNDSALDATALLDLL